MIDVEVLNRALLGLRDTVFVDRDVTAALQRIVEAAVAVFGVTGSGLMFVDDTRALRYVAASDENSRALEVSQEKVGEGPCVDSLVNGTVFLTPDVQTDERWPRLAPLLEGTPVHAVLGVPVLLGGGPVGSLNVYLDKRHVWDEGDMASLQAFNSIVEELIGSAVLAHRHETVVDQLQHALDNRVTIERAVGVIMGRHNRDAVSAFNELRTSARSGRRKVIDVAQDVLSGYEPRNLDTT